MVPFQSSPPHSFAKRSRDYKPSLLLFSALGSPPFRSVKLRPRKPSCVACGTRDGKLAASRQADYVQFCGGPLPNWEDRGLVRGSAEERISPKVDDSHYNLF